MLFKFNFKYPQTKPLEKEVYGKRVIFTGFDSVPEIETAYERGVRDICIGFNVLMRVADEDLYNLIDKFDVVGIDANSHELLNLTGNEQSYQTMCNLFVEFIERHINHLTFAIEPKHILSVLGEDIYLDYQREYVERNLPIFPVIQKEDISLYTDEILPYVTHAVIDGSESFNTAFIRKVEKRCTENEVEVITRGINQPLHIQKSDSRLILSDGWKHGTKYGTSYFFNDLERMMVYPQKSKRAIWHKMAQHIRNLGVNYDALLQDIPDAFEHLNTLSWLHYGDFLAVQPHRTVWLDDIELATLKQKYVGTVSEDPVFSQVPILQDAKDKLRKELTVANPELAEAPLSKFKMLDARQMVAVQCDTCPVRDRCPEYKPKAPCAYHSNAVVTSRDDLRNALGAFFTMSLNRVQHASFIERMEGGELSESLSKQIEQTFKNAKILSDIQKEGSVTLTARGKNGSTISTETEMGGALDMVKQVMEGVSNQSSGKTVNVEPKHEES